MKDETNISLHTMCNCFTDDTVRVTDECMLKKAAETKMEMMIVDRYHLRNSGG